jgi:hypothetical protein
MVVDHWFGNLDFHFSTITYSFISYLPFTFQAKMPASKNADVQVVTGRHKRDIKGAFEEVKKTLYDTNRSALLAKAATYRAQQRALTKQIRRAEQGGCACFSGGGGAASDAS